MVQDDKHLVIKSSRNKISTQTLSVLKVSTSKSPSFANIIARLQSFKSWPKSMAQTPLALAEAGFFYTGTGDKVSCFSCGLRPINWKTQDNIWKVHRVYSPNMHFYTNNGQGEAVRPDQHVIPLLKLFFDRTLIELFYYLK